MSKKLTIGLLLDDSLDRSDGVQQAVISIGEKLRSRGHDVHYIVTETKRTDLQSIHVVSGYVSLQFNGNSVRTPKPAAKRQIKELLEKVTFDVLHVQMPFSPLLSARVLAMAPHEVVRVGTFHILPYNVIAKHGTKLLGAVMRRSIHNIDHYFAVSKPAKEFMDSSFSVEGRVLPNPVDYAFFHGFAKEKKDKKQIVFVGRFEDRKGVKELIEAYAKLSKEIRDNTELTMISKGPLHESMKTRAHELGVEISFPGFVTEEEKAQALANADIAVFPSISGESFGIVLTEAMSAGAGITLGGNNPGYASVLHEWPETLFNPQDISGFAMKLQHFLEDDADRQRIGAMQREAVKQYDIEIIVDELEKAYQSK